MVTVHALERTYETVRRFDPQDWLREGEDLVVAVFGYPSAPVKAVDIGLEEVLREMKAR